MRRHFSILFALLLTSSLEASVRSCLAPSIGADVTNISHRIRADHEIPEFVGGGWVRVVYANTPAAKAGLERGDVVQSVGNQLVQNACGFEKAVALHGCRKFTMTVRRGMQTLKIDVEPVETLKIPKEEAAAGCRNGDGSACFEQAVAGDPQKYFLRRGCDLGHGASCYNLAIALGVSDPQANGPYEQACDAGFSRACTNLGWMYENGRGLPVDMDAARRLYQKGCDGSACDPPNGLGCMNVGRLYLAGNGVPKDEVKAIRLFRGVCQSPQPEDDSEAASNIARACSLAGTAMIFGDGVVKTVLQGLIFLEKGCAAGDTFGCYNLGVVYERGEDVKKDAVRALAFYQRACDRGDTEACASRDRLTRQNTP